MKVIIAEKPSVARSIAECLGIKNKQDGYFEGNGYYLTWAFGHLVGLKSPEEHNPAWKAWKMDELPMIPVNFELKANNDDGAKKQLSVIKTLFGKADEIICATDAGREGELIFRYILSWTGFESMPVKRLWISSLTDESIRTGFNGLKDGRLFDNLYKAAKCRSESDWLVGLNATRAYSIKFGQQGTLLTVGRVQTPVLAMITQRDNDIANFIPKDFWELNALYKDVLFQHTGGRFNSKPEAEALLKKLSNHDLVVTDVTGKREQVLPPLLYDLTDLQKDLNVRQGFTADQTLTLVQQLYEKKHVSYPRTDSRYLSNDMKAGMLSILESLHGQFTAQISPLPSGSMPDNRYFNDAKVTDHHAIIPTTTPPNSLSSDESIVYQAIALRFISAFYQPCIKQVTTVQATINGENFKVSGTIIESQGWQVLYKNDNKDKDKILPPFVKGESGTQQPSITQGKTTPPKPFTEATLLGMMESAGKTCEDGVYKDTLKESGLGTPATRAQIIEGLIKRSFICRNKNNVTSTESGRALIKLIQSDNLKSAALTGEWEYKLKQIEQGEYSPDLFMREIVDFTQKIKADVEGINYSPVITNSLGDCPSCSDGKIIDTPKAYSCSNWKTGCKFTIWKVISKKPITLAVAKELLVKGETKIIKGFKSKDDKEFEASLKLVNGKIIFSF